MPFKYNTYKRKDSNYKVKFWDNPDELYGKNIRRIDEDIWFKVNQKLLLWLANTKSGRDLLCIHQNFPKIDLIKKNVIRGIVDIKQNKDKTYKVTYLSSFRIGTKWANVIRYRWPEFQKAALHYYKKVLIPKYSRISISRLIPFPVIAFNPTNTFVPDPGNGANTVDGDILLNDAGNVWATEHDKTTATASADTATELGFRCDAAGTGGNFIINRAFILFNTGPDIPDGNSIDSGTVTLLGFGKADNQGDAVNIVQSAPASNTDIVDGDFDAYTDLHSAAVAATEITLANWSTTADNVFTLNSTGLGFVSKTGVTKLGIRLKKDFNEGTGHLNAPTTGTSFGQCKSADATGTADDPELSVTHSVPAGGASQMMLMGVGM